MTPLQIAKAAADVAAHLQGTGGRIEHSLDVLDLPASLEDNKDFCLALDTLAFECQRCNWWCEASEMANRKDQEWICDDCTDETELEDE